MALDPKRSMKPWMPHRSTDEVYYEHQAYPKMMTKPCTEADIKDWMEHNNSIEGGKVVYRGSRPVLGSPIAVLDAARNPVIVNSADEEAEFLKINPPPAGTSRVEVPAAAAHLSMVTNTADIAAKEKEIADLKARLAQKPRPRPKVRRRPHPPARVPQNLIPPTEPGGETGTGGPGTGGPA